MSNITIKKSHELTTARYSFSLMEMRMFSLIVSMIDDRDEEFKVYKIPIKNIINTFDIKSKTIYAEISQLTSSMLKKIITIPVKEDGKDKEIKTALVSSFKYAVDGRGVLEATFHPLLKPYLLQLKSKFLLYDLKNILKISSGHSIRFYELLKSYEWIGKRVFEVEELKQILCLEDKYSKYANFKKRILLKAQEDIEAHTDIRFEFEEISEYSRRVEKLAFTIYKNKKNKVVKNGAEESASSDEHIAGTTSRQDTIRTLGVSKTIIENQIAGQYEEDYIIQTLKHSLHYFKNKPVKQKGGFVLKALSEQYFKEDIEKESKKKFTKKILQQKVVQDEEDKQQEALAKQWLIEKLRAQYLSDEFIEAVLEEHRDSFLYSIMEKSWKEGKVNKYLDAFVNKKLVEEFGEKGL